MYETAAIHFDFEPYLQHNILSFGLPVRSAGGNHLHVAPDVRCASPPSPTATETADIGRCEKLHSMSSKSPSVSSAPLAMQDAKSAEEGQGDILWGNSYQLIGNKG